MLRKPVSKNLAAVIEDPNTKQLSLNFGDHHKLDKMRIYEYAVLVTSLPDEVVSIAQHYRDRADSENVFDENAMYGCCIHSCEFIQHMEIIHFL